MKNDYDNNNNIYVKYMSISRNIIICIYTHILYIYIHIVYIYIYYNNIIYIYIYNDTHII